MKATTLAAALFALAAPASAAVVDVELQLDFRDFLLINSEDRDDRFVLDDLGEDVAAAIIADRELVTSGRLRVETDDEGGWLSSLCTLAAVGICGGSGLDELDELAGGGFSVGTYADQGLALFSWMLNPDGSGELVHVDEYVLDGYPGYEVQARFDVTWQPAPSPVPLPGAFWLLLAGAAAITAAATRSAYRS